ncbi:hypothetical protein OC846_003477 [Tilletia horrida]|uniref:Major facilitator superfamily (MFS) profile domain-containing protein n=1 Tax=Tilletia horrida TaxID=155126 RepID=A0AAN6JTV6_9BASI|nr:hypothetical protein OC846_003477 [Tilletia horrida]
MSCVQQQQQQQQPTPPALPHSSSQDDNKDAVKTPRRLMIKIDIILMTLTTIAFGLQYYDKALLSSASLFGILRDLDLSKPLPNGKLSLTRFSSASSAFYWGYLSASIPLSLIVQRMRLNLFLGGAITLWGLVAILTPTVTNYRGLIAQRFFLGAVESAVSPGFVLITRMWYTREEHPIRLGIWFSANGLFSVFAGVVNYGIGKAASRPQSPVSPWKALYFFAGGLTCLFGLIVLALLPPSPQRDPLLKIRWLNYFSANEKAELARRTRIDRNLTKRHLTNEKDSSSHPEDEKDDVATTVETASVAGANQRAWKKEQIIEALTDYKIYIYFVQASCLYLTNGGVTSFSGVIVKSFNYTSQRAVLMQAPGGAVTVVSIFFFTLLARRTRNCLHALLALSCIPTLVGAIMIWKSNWSHRAVPLSGFYLLAAFGAPFALLLASATANVRGSTKQSISSAAIFLGYNVGNIIAPYLVKAQQVQQHYRDCFISIIFGMCMTMVLSVVLIAAMHYENRARDREQQQPPNEPVTIPLDDDLTDRQDRTFRYSL